MPDMPTPTRVLINADGTAVTPGRALADYGVTYQFVFVRNDGWSLGVPEHLKEVARAMWRSEWAHVYELVETVRPNDNEPEPDTERPENVDQRVWDVTNQLRLFTVSRERIDVEYTQSLLTTAFKDDRAAERIKTLEEAARLMCFGCAGDYEPAVSAATTRGARGAWYHGDGPGAQYAGCTAGKIHDALEAERSS